MCKGHDNELSIVESPNLSQSGTGVAGSIPVGEGQESPSSPAIKHLGVTVIPPGGRIFYGDTVIEADSALGLTATFPFGWAHEIASTYFPPYPGAIKGIKTFIPGRYSVGQQESSGKTNVTVFEAGKLS
jgi:hypothetical protein